MGLCVFENGNPIPQPNEPAGEHNYYQPVDCGYF
jgi:hypothetical protein